MKRLLRFVHLGELSIGFVAAMCCVAHLGYYSVFLSWGFMVVVVVSAVGASAVHIFVRRRQLLLGQAALAYTIGFVLLGLLATQWPLGFGAFQGFGRDVTAGWTNLLSSQIPTALSQDARAVVFASAWVTSVLALELDHRLPYYGVALVGSLVGLVSTSLLATEARFAALVQGPVLIGLTLILAATQRTASERTRGLTRTRRSFHGPAKWAIPAVLLGAIGLGGALAGPQLPLADDSERFDLRAYQENPWDPLEQPSPLTTIKAFLKDGQDGLNEPLFVARSDMPITRWTHAVMASYNGVVWQVADPVQATPAQFVPIDQQIPGFASGDRYESAVEASITIEGLTGPWLPHPGRPIDIERSPGVELRVNLATGSLASPMGLQEGDVFMIRGAVHPSAGGGGIGADVLVGDPSVIDLTLVPSNITNLAAELVTGIDVGGPQIAAIRDAFVVGGFYDISESTPPGHGYQDIAEFIDDTEHLVGFEEQYAATAAVLARVAELPVRVATGFVIPEDRYESGEASVLPSDATAWIEVLVAGAGWVPVDVTPDRSREPTEDIPGTVVRSVAIPNEPPPPPPPLDSDPIDEEEEEEEDEEDEEDEEALVESRTLFQRLLDRPELVAVGVGVIPMFGFVLLAAATVAIKAVRRRRRRLTGTPRRRVVGAWAEFVDRFEEAGYVVPVNATPRELAEQIAQSDAVSEPDRVRELARMTIRAAFARTEPAEEDIDRAWLSASEASADAVEQLGPLERLRAHCDPRPLRSRRKVRV